MDDVCLAQALRQYSTALAALETAAAPLAAAQVLAVLVGRDTVHTALTQHPPHSTNDLLTVIQLDSRLKQQEAAMASAAPLADWRRSCQPPSDAWWWCFTPPQRPHGWDRLDWLWNAMSVVLLTVALSLVVDISGRFLSGGPDTLGAMAVIGQSVLTLLAAGGALTQTGRDVSRRLLRRLRLPQYYWAEAQVSFAAMLLVGLVALYGVLPWIAILYNNRGVMHYRTGRLTSAEAAYQRALKLTPDFPGAHYNLGLLYEDLRALDRAQAAYQVALKGGLDAAYNNLARLSVLAGQPMQAVALLAEGLTRAQDDTVRYDMLKNLGWAWLKHKQYPEEAERALRQAIDLAPDQAPARCLLAQVLEEHGQEGRQPETLQEWEQCLRWASPTRSPDEHEWIAQAHRRLAGAGEKK